MMFLFLFLLLFVISLIAFFAWQHWYFHPMSMRDIKKRERELLEKASEEIRRAKQTS